MFDAQLLRTFVTIVDEGGFTKAALRLNLTQSAVSGHVRRLEEQAGSPLLVRLPRRLELTTEGTILLGYARSIVTLQEEVRGRLNRRPRLAGVLRVGTCDEVMSRGLPAILRRFSAACPGAVIDLAVEDATRLLDVADAGGVDLVFGPRCAGDDRGETLWIEPVEWLVAAGFMPAAGDALPLALFQEPCPFRAGALSALSHAGLRWRSACVSPSLSSIVDVVRSGLALAPLSRFWMGDELVVASPDFQLPSLPAIAYGLYCSRRAPQPLTDAFAAFIKCELPHWVGVLPAGHNAEASTAAMATSLS
jgi:DNA-binding transcriptional LysR family regulator